MPVSCSPIKRQNSVVEVTRNIDMLQPVNGDLYVTESDRFSLVTPKRVT